MLNLWPDLVVLLNARSCASLAGILCISVATWFNDRKWDEQAAQQYFKLKTGFSGSKENDGDVYKEIEDGCGSGTTDRAVRSGGGGVGNGSKSGTSHKAVRSGGAGNADTDPSSNYVVVGGGGGGVSLAETKASADGAVVAEIQRGQEESWGFSYVTALGWALLSFAYALERHEWFGWSMFSYHSSSSSIGESVLICVNMALILVLGYLQTVTMRRAVIRREITARRTSFVATMGCGLLLIAILTVIIDPEAPFWAAPLGAVCVAGSSVVLWKSRKMGEVWDKEGRPNPRPVVYNFGAPLQVFGWYWMWIGMNAVNASPSYMYLPVYLSTRTMLSFLGAVFVTFVFWLVEYAIDEVDRYRDDVPAGSSSNDDKNDDNDDAPAFGVAGIFFGATSEIKMLMVPAWILWGLVAFFPVYGNVFPYVLLVVMTVQGICVSMIYERGYKPSNIKSYNIWITVVGVMFLVITICIGVQGPLQAIFSLFGVSAVGYGQYILSVDRKRGGKYVLEQQQQDPGALARAKSVRNPGLVVYSHGAPLFAIGMLFLAYSLTIP